MKTTLSYPKILRPILAAEFNRQQSAGFMFTDSRAGKIYTKKIAQNPPTFINAAFKFNSHEAAIFQSWYRNTLNMACLPFMMPIVTEWGEINYECQFVPDSLLSASKQGDVWSYSAMIMIRDYGPPDYLPIDIEYYPHYFDVKARSWLDRIVNTQLNKVT